jgi:hypothetical protein
MNPAHSASQDSTGTRICILACLFNDWISADKLAEGIDQELADRGLVADIVFVNDGSTEEKPPGFCTARYKALGNISVVHAKTNLGHQRAIALGLWFVNRNCDHDAFAIMDSDGEDKPSDLVKLIGKWSEGRGSQLIFAERTKRSEGVVFRLCYAIYKFLHLALTGRRISFGNYSVLSGPHVELLLVEPDLWNHYAAAVVKTKIPFATVATNRGTRYAGQSRLNFTSLVIHGLSALSCFKEIIAVRLILAALVTMGLMLVLGISLLGVKVFSSYAIQGWTTSAMGVVVMVFTQLLVILSLFVIGLLGGRNQYSFMPVRDCEYYFGRVEAIGPVK